MAFFWNGVAYTSFQGFKTIPDFFDLSAGNFSISTTITRFGSGQSINVGNGGTVSKNLLANLGTLIDGIAFYTGSLPGSGFNSICQWFDVTGGVVQVSLQYNGSGQLQFFSGSGTGSPLGPLSAAGVIRGSAWTFLERKIVFATGTGGSVECRVWGPGGSGSTPVISTGSLNTAPSGNAWCSRSVFLGVSAGHFFQDWYLLDTTGSSPLNTYLGPIRVAADAPNNDSATGGLNQFTSSDAQPAGSHYHDVNKLPFGGTDTPYLSDSVVGDRESFRFPNLTASQVFALQMLYRQELDAAGARTIKPIFRSNSVDDTAAEPKPAVTPSTVFAFFQQASTIDPNTSAMWAAGSVAAAQACEMGIKIDT